MKAEEKLHTEKAILPTKHGDFELIAFAKNEKDWMPHLALKHQKLNNSEPVIVRIHSECITGDLFHSERCDCGPQLDASLEVIAEQRGLLIYLRQEGRGIGILNKLKAYNLQDDGMDTVKANTHLGLDADAREYHVAIEILNSLGISQIKLLTNNPEKMKAFDGSDIEIVERIPLRTPIHKNNQKYMDTKRDEMGHLI